MADLILPVQEEQALSLVRQLSLQSKRVLLHDLLEELGEDEFEQMVDRNIVRVHRIAAKQGLDWDMMSEAERTTFFEQLLDE